MAIWGIHQRISARGLDPYKVKDTSYVKEFISCLVEAIDMKAMMPPMAIYCDTDDEDKRGVTGFVIIQTSNIGVHFLDSFEGEPSVVLDVFTCKDFDTSISTKVLQDWFEGPEYTFRITEDKTDERNL
jgi:S-adenosylmethionine/arginine decarboxylase-like enzyme